GGGAPSARVSRSRAMPAGGRRSEAAPPQLLANPAGLRLHNNWCAAHPHGARCAQRSGTVQDHEESLYRLRTEM
ncbi:MAG: hypothetical protein OXI45_03330, partial [Acidobacteriota bacterium]|nr:hypothetical protein [Acidobacteriota bacterium]